tara:strand:- start:2296 stop:3210 length:915 start_codon:yes stop_codon:yes gene_type:complete
MKNLTVLVIGDSMIDTYIFGEVSRISPEAPVPVLKLNKKNHLLGGAANVAHQIKGFGLDTTLISSCGLDDNANVLIDELKNKGITQIFDKRDVNRTIVKTRFLSRNQQMLRVDDEKKNQPINIKIIERCLSDKLPDICILSDYNKGSLSNCKDIIDLLNKKNVMTIIDPKGLDFDKYKNGSIITPNRDEIFKILGCDETSIDFVQKSQILLKDLNLKNIIVTLGSKGAMVISATDHMVIDPIQVKELDVTGAGDTFISSLAFCLSKGDKLDAAVKFANTSAGLSVQEVGVTFISEEEVLKRLKS